jgi:hypothetical protein
MKALDNMTYGIVAGMVILIFFSVITLKLLNPALSQPALAAKMASTIALYIDTMSVVESGTIRIPSELGTTYYVRVSYEEKGKKEGYEINDEGWYVVVHSKRGDEETTSTSRIHAYPPTASRPLGTEISGIRTVCVSKEKGDYPRLTDCR